MQQTGFWELPTEAGWTPPPGLEDFLQAGPRPLGVGFGSMGDRDPAATARLVVAAATQARVRVVLLTGWNGGDDAPRSDDIFRLASAPHHWLYPRLAGVVHHGGAGTTAAGILAGQPTQVVPFFADQPFWGDLLWRRGVGLRPIPRARLTVDNLATALRQLADDARLRQAAATLGVEVRAEPGAEAAATALRAHHQHWR